ncbi:MAG: hypothetical protein D6723_09075 [Acidobacteria bacterium]|nr:MAG: hypothetical protein D6723_09075 [Acidobacteriota bacterium]
MKKITGWGGLLLPLSIVASGGMLPQIAALVVVFLGGGIANIGAILSGIGGVLLQFILSFVVQEGLTPLEMVFAF